LIVCGIGDDDDVDGIEVQLPLNDSDVGTSQECIDTINPALAAVLGLVITIYTPNRSVFAIGLPLVSPSLDVNYVYLVRRAQSCTYSTAQREEAVCAVPMICK
jgi:hypothetical protein